MALTMFQQQRYMYRVSLYRPNDITPFPDADSATDAVADDGWQVMPAYTNVPCLFVSTPEVDLPEAEGLNKEANIFTLDKFTFDVSQEISNTWGIVITQIFSPQTPNLSSIVGGWWICQDNPQGNPSLPLILMNEAAVFGKRGPKPAGIT